MPPGVASAFKEACLSANVSMASEILRFMAAYAGRASPKHEQQAPDYSTRRKRRAALRTLASQVGQIKAAEGRCRDNTPENLRGSEAYEAADECASHLGEALELLESVY